MRKTIIITAILLAISCKKEISAPSQTPADAPATANQAKDSIEPYVYEGQSKHVSGFMIDTRIKIYMKAGAGSGEFEREITYYPANSTYEGKKLENQKEKGTFTIEKSQKFGGIYVLKGTKEVFYYQDQGSKLAELNHDKTETTGLILGGVPD